MKGLKRSDSEHLKQVLYQGLKRELRTMAVYQCNTISDYNRFNMELRKLESGLKEETVERKPCKPIVQTEPKKEEMSELSNLLRKLNDKIDKLGSQQEAGSYRNGDNRRYFGGRRFSRGDSYRGAQGGRGQYQVQRPVASRTFQPTCYSCGEKGHMPRQCPKVTKVTCFSCNKEGHKAYQCPNC